MGKVLDQIALHFQAGGSDKVWAAAYTDDGVYKAAWGRRGSAIEGPPKQMDLAGAKKLFEKKRDEKLGEGYVQVPFDDPTYGLRSFGEGAAPVVAQTIKQTVSGYYTSHVMPMGDFELESLLLQDIGLSEKANGQRCVVVSDGQTLATYNRRGKSAGQPPSGVAKLTKLNRSFVLDGERMEGNLTGTYVAFDLLEFDGEDLRSKPYSERLRQLTMNFKGLVDLVDSQVTSEGNKFQILTAATEKVAAQKLFSEVQSKGGEGVVVRNLGASYQVGDSYTVRKIKFVADVDVIITRVKPGLGAGSLEMGLYAPDGKIIPVGSVRSGLNDADINSIAGRMAKGEQIVMKVSYLPARTVGTSLVEPRTAIDEVREDKNPAECTLDQLGEAKVNLWKGTGI